VNQNISAIQDSYKNGVTPSAIAIAASNVADEFSAIEQRLPNIEDLALESGRRVSSGSPRALEGIPFSVKANIDVAGIATTNGTAMENQPAAKSARIVDLLCNAGAIPVFTTTMAELAIGAVTDNAHTGTCVTPNNPKLHAGGSSGGSGASVAAGWVPFSLGSDTMGSVRIPAAYCGVFGFKPSSQVIDRSGLTPLYPPMDTIGIIANSVSDIQSVLAVCAEENNSADLDATTTLFVPSFTRESNSDVLANFNNQLKKIRLNAINNGLAVIDLELDLDLGLLRRRGLLLCEVTAWNNFSQTDAVPAGISEPVASLLRYGASAKLERIDDARELLAKTLDLVARVLDKFPGHPMLILPVTPFSQPDLSATNEDLATSADFTCLANICDLPAISIPAPEQAIQLMAKNGDDHQLLKVAKIIYSILR
jgi:aspartyl-tRNA(Asn)/glutamyl-tRNA(Gln) amidotransferase subunit A